MNKKIKLSSERKEIMKLKIMEYFRRERDEDLGELASQLILDFFLEELGAEIYNQGVEDSHNYLFDKLEDLYALKIVRR